MLTRLDDIGEQLDLMRAEFDALVAVVDARGSLVPADVPKLKRLAREIAELGDELADLQRKESAADHRLAPARCKPT